MITIKYTVEEGGQVRFFGKSTQSVKQILSWLTKKRHYDTRASRPVPMIQLAKHSFVHAVILYDKKECVGRIHADTKGMVISGLKG